MPEGVVVLWIVGAAFFGVISGVIWQNKGGDFAAGFLLGLVLGIFGLLLVAVMTPGGNKLAPAAGARPAVTWTHSGVRYLMGYTTQPPAYGLWDREAPGPPIIAFPYTDHGKVEALARFQEMEPHGQAVPLPNTPPPPPPLIT